jgi:hypothetical protein
MISIAVMSFLIGTTFNIMSFAEDGNPFDEIWEAIHKLDAQVESMNQTIQFLNQTIKELETRLPKRGYVSISAAAFRSYRHIDGNANYDYSNYGHVLYPESAYMRFYASIQLPHKATATNMTVFLHSPHAGEYPLFMRLLRNNLNGTAYTMAKIDVSYFEEGTNIFHDDTIEHAEIDNQSYAYFLEIYYKDMGASLYGVVIEYEYQAR